MNGSADDSNLKNIILHSNILLKLDCVDCKDPTRVYVAGGNPG